MPERTCSSATSHPCWCVDPLETLHRSELSHRSVHIKLTPDGQFEGCEPAALWPGAAHRRLPEVYARPSPTWVV